MTDQQQPPAIDPSSENLKHQPMIPYERFAEVNRELKGLRSQTNNPQQVINEEKLSDFVPSSGSEAVDDIFRRLVKDPEAYLKEVVSHVIQHEIKLLQEELELKNALKYARQRYPEFKSFENYIIQELTGIVNEDPDSVKLSWDEIMDKGVERLQSKLKTAFQNMPEKIASNSGDEVRKAYIEGHSARKPQPVQPSFSRDEIAKMSLKDFLQNEEIINEALKNKRIH